MCRLGAFLSGGVDSSSVVGQMAERTNGVKTFSIGFTTKKFDELRYARVIAERYGTEHHEEVVTPDIDEMFDRLVEHFDEPFADNSAIPMLYLSRMTRRHVTVALSGDGVDEIFAGYRLYYYGWLESRIRAKYPDWFRRSVMRLAGRWYPKLDFMPQVFRAKSLLTNLSLELAEAHYNTRAYFGGDGLERVLTPEMKRDLAGYHPRETMRQWFAPHAELPPLEQMQAVDHGDMAARRHSGKGRPHHHGVLAGGSGAVSGLPARRVGRPLAGAVQDCRVATASMSSSAPWSRTSRRNCSTGRKMGFSVPMAEWMRSSLKPRFERLVMGGGMQGPGQRG